MEISEESHSFSGIDGCLNSAILYFSRDCSISGATFLLLYELMQRFGREFGDFCPFTPQSSHRQGSWVLLLTQSLSR